LLITTLRLETNPEEATGGAEDVRPDPEGGVGVLAARPMSTVAALMAPPGVVTGMTMLETIGTTTKPSTLGTSVEDGTTVKTENVVTL
jgi:hypothetical protein